MAKAFTKVVEVERVVKESKEVVVVEMSKREAAYVLAVLGCVCYAPWARNSPPIYDALQNLFNPRPFGTTMYDYSKLDQECRHWVESQPE